MRKALIACGMIWLAFAGCGLMMHHACRNAPKNELGWTDIAGYDSEGYVTHFTSPVGLMEIHHRHPLMAVATAPITLVGLLVSFRAGLEIGYQAVICCFSLFGAVTCLLLWLVLKKAGALPPSRLAAMSLWLSFSHVWILGGIAESYNISQLILVGVLLMVVSGVRNARAWFGMAALAGGVTITNGVKPLVAWIVAADGMRFVRKLRMRTIGLAAAIVAVTMILSGLLLAAKWVWLDGMSAARGLEITVNEVVKVLPDDFSLSRRLWLAWNAFWCEPMLLREGVICQSLIVHSYRTALPHLLGAAVLVLCAWSAMRNFRLPVVRAALSMVVFDVVLHVVLGWGNVEGQIYCGHWFWIIPLLVALLPRRAAYVTATLAVCIAVHNIVTVLWIPGI